jgi:hypothetical protein
MWTEDQYDEFSDKMRSSYPKMFANPMGGFAVGSGWWHILESLCERIHSHVEWKQNQLEKYKQGQGCPDVHVSQIKEKFGGLRFYYDGGDEYISGLVAMAESWASVTCEKCGNPGSLRSGGWMQTLCDTHHQEYQSKLKKRTEE